MDGISVIIPTLNRENYISSTISMLERQMIGVPFEIIVVDQSDVLNIELDNLAQKKDCLKYYYIENFRGLPEARNFGVSKSLYDFILFLDDDINIDSDILVEHLKYLNNPEIGVVAGGITEKNRQNIDVCRVGYFDYFRALPFRGYHMDKNGYVDHAGGGNYSIKKSVFLQVGGVDEYLNYGAALHEETEICLRVKERGFKIFFNYKAHITHLAAETGGCSISNIRKYVESLVHNKALVISRHLKWYQKPFAILYLFKVVTSFVLNNKDLSLYSIFMKAYIEGSKKGELLPLNTFL